MNRWVIGDIHGCARTLRALFSQMNPEKTDEIYFVGDYIDRGLDSKGVIDYIWELEESGYQLFCLKGNHEEYMLNAYEAELNPKKVLFFKQKNRVMEDWLFHGGKETLVSFDAQNVLDVPVKYIEWLRKLKLYFELPGHIIVHAGLNFKKVDPFEDTHAMLWIRDFEIDAAKIGNKKVIHGHVPVGQDFIKESVGTNRYPFVDIDNGCVYNDRDGMGYLIAYEINSGDFLSQQNVDLY